MSLPLLHSPAKVLSELVKAMGLGVAPTTPPSQTSWQVYTDNEPTVPDDCITVKDTTPQADGRTMPDGEQMIHWGMQIRIRAIDFPTGFAKAEGIKVALDEQVYANTVPIDAAVYLVPCIVKTSLLPIGKDSPTSKRSVFTINCLAPIRRIS